MEKQNDLIDVTDNKPAIKKKKSTTKAVVVQKIPVSPLSESGQLLQMAMEKNVSMEMLAQFMELRNKDEDRNCKKEFELHFAIMKNELPTIEKTMEVTNDQGGHMYDFAPLAKIQALCDPIISKHKFSYYWGELEIPERKVKRVTFYLSGYGHTRENSFDVVEIPTSKWANAIQVGGIRSSYGERYTMVGGLGLILKGIDNDAAHLTFSDGVEYAEQIVWLKSCNSREDLLTVFKKIVDELKKKNDTIGKGVLTAIYTDLKKELK